jgi:hypothetical protein
MDGALYGPDPSNTRGRNIQITTHYNSNNPYSQHNPYELVRPPLTPTLNKQDDHSRHSSSNRNTYTETSRSKSAKMIRANGLTKMQKPKIDHLRPEARNNHQLHGSQANRHLNNGDTSREQLESQR